MLKLSIILLVTTVFGILASASPTETNAINQRGRKKSKTSSIISSTSSPPVSTSTSTPPIPSPPTSTASLPPIPSNTLFPTPSDEPCTCLREGTWCAFRYNLVPGVSGNCALHGLHTCTAADIGKAPSRYTQCDQPHFTNPTQCHVASRFMVPQIQYMYLDDCWYPNYSWKERS